MDIARFETAGPWGEGAEDPNLEAAESELAEEKAADAEKYLQTVLATLEVYNPLVFLALIVMAGKNLDKPTDLLDWWARNRPGSEEMARIQASVLDVQAGRDVR